MVTARCWPGRAESGEFVLVRDGQPAVTIVVAAAAAVLGGYWGYQRAAASTYFTVQRIEVAGAQRV